MPRITELPPLETGNLRQDLHRMREYMIRFVQNFAMEEAGYASSNDSQGNSSSDAVTPIGITVDSELSEESINPVENRVIAAALKSIPITEIMVSTHLLNVTVLGNEFGIAYGNVAAEGYTPLGIVSVFPLNSSLEVTYFAIMAPASAQVRVRNSSSSQITSNIAVLVLYKKNEDTS